MPAKLSAISEGVADRAVDVGKLIRAHRKALGVSATTAAEAAGMSRVTWDGADGGGVRGKFGRVLLPPGNGRPGVHTKAGDVEVNGAQPPFAG